MRVAVMIDRAKAMRGRRGGRPGLWVGLLWVCTGCAASFNPRPPAEVGFLERAQTHTQQAVRVTTAVPSAAETTALFGVSLYRRGIQPVWLEVENQRGTTVTFLPVGLDPGYFTPIEAANLHRKQDDLATNSEMNRYFFEQGMSINVSPGEVRTGFMFTPLDEGTKTFNVDIVSDDTVLGFTFFVPVPGLRVDHHRVDWEALYPEDQLRTLGERELIEALEEQPCCVTDKNAEGTGDPLNLVVIGDRKDVYYAFIRAGWDETETVYGASAWKTALSFLFGGEYRYSPVSALYLFGRAQDVAMQKARGNIHERNHLRLWLSPLRVEDKPVWLGQISRDIGVRFNWPTITTHKIDPDVDETREFLLEDLAYSQALAKIGYVGGVGEAPIDVPRGNLTGDPYFTDGYRVVLWVSSQPVDIADLEILRWRTPPDRRAP